MVWFRDRENKGPSDEVGIDAPAIVAASTATAPTSDAATTYPLRKRYMYQPTNRAIGIVQAIVNVPHELPGTSRFAPSGRTQPSPSGLLFMALPDGTSSVNGSLKVIVWAALGPNW